MTRVENICSFYLKFRRENHFKKGGITSITVAEFCIAWLLILWCILRHLSTNLSRRESDFFQWRLWQSCVQRFLWWVLDTSCLWCRQRQAGLSRSCPTHTHHRRQPTLIDSIGSGGRLLCFRILLISHWQNHTNTHTNTATHKHMRSHYWKTPTLRTTHRNP